jgi:hypothetical protein
MAILPKREPGDCHSGAPPATLGAGSRRGICFFCLFALTLACATAPVRAAAYELGRLFFTPEQRQDLDRRRTSNRTEQEAPQITEGPLILNGHVERSSGRTTTWINGAPLYDQNRAGRDPAQVTVVPNPGEPGVTLKVGQTYERTTGAVSGILNGGEITVRESPSNAPPAAERSITGKSPAQTR